MQMKFILVPWFSWRANTKARHILSDFIAACTQFGSDTAISFTLEFLLGSNRLYWHVLGHKSQRQNSSSGQHQRRGCGIKRSILAGPSWVLPLHRGASWNWHFISLHGGTAQVSIMRLAMGGSSGALLAASAAVFLQKVLMSGRISSAKLTSSRGRSTKSRCDRRQCG